MASSEQQERAVTQALSGIGAAIGKKIVLLNPGAEYERAKLLLAQCGFQVERQAPTSPAARPTLFLVNAPHSQLCHQQPLDKAPTRPHEQCRPVAGQISEYVLADLNQLGYGYARCV